MQDKWTETHRRNFKKFWNSDLGKESKQILTDLKQTKLDVALTLTDKDEIATNILKAAGIDEALQYIESLAN